MADREPAERTRRGPELITLFVALITLGGAAMTLFDWQPPAPLVDPRWLLAGAAVLVGLLLLLASVRSGRRRANRP